MRLGGYVDNSGRPVLNWEQLRDLKPNDTFGGGWIVTSASRNRVPRKQTYLMNLTLSESNKNNSSDVIAVKLWDCPKDFKEPANDSLFLIPQCQASMKIFNGKYSIHVKYPFIKIIQPQNVESFKKQNLSPNRPALSPNRKERIKRFQSTPSRITIPKPLSQSYPNMTPSKITKSKPQSYPNMTPFKQSRASLLNINGNDDDDNAISPQTPSRLNLEIINNIPEESPRNVHKKLGFALDDLSSDDDDRKDDVPEQTESLSDISDSNSINKVYDEDDEVGANLFKQFNEMQNNKNNKNNDININNNDNETQLKSQLGIEESMVITRKDIPLQIINYAKTQISLISPSKVIEWPPLSQLDITPKNDDDDDDDDVDETGTAPRTASNSTTDTFDYVIPSKLIYEFDLDSLDDGTPSKSKLITNNIIIINEKQSLSQQMINNNNKYNNKSSMNGNNGIIHQKSKFNVNMNKNKNKLAPPPTPNAKRAIPPPTPARPKSNFNRHNNQIKNKPTHVTFTKMNENTLFNKNVLDCMTPPRAITKKLMYSTAKKKSPPIDISSLITPETSPIHNNNNINTMWNMDDINDNAGIIEEQIGFNFHPPTPSSKQRAPPPTPCSKQRAPPTPCAKQRIPTPSGRKRSFNEMNKNIRDINRNFNKNLNKNKNKNKNKKNNLFTDSNDVNNNNIEIEFIDSDNDNDGNEPSPKKRKLTPKPLERGLTSTQKRKIEQNRIAAQERLKIFRMNTELDRIYVIDLETTSFPPAIPSAENGDVIIEIAIVQFNRISKKIYTIKPVLHCFINPESYGNYPENWKDSWIFKNGTTIDMVQHCGLDFNIIFPEIRKMLNGCYVTSYNTEFDLHSFLKKPPFNVQCKEYECIMKLCEMRLSLTMPSLESSAHSLLGMDYYKNVSLHNAMEDALTAAKILPLVIVDL